MIKLISTFHLKGNSRGRGRSTQYRTENTGILTYYYYIPLFSTWLIQASDQRVQFLNPEKGEDENEDKLSPFTFYIYLYKKQKSRAIPPLKSISYIPFSWLHFLSDHFSIVILFFSRCELVFLARPRFCFFGVFREINVKVLGNHTKAYIYFQVYQVLNLLKCFLLFRKKKLGIRLEVLAKRFLEILIS